MSNTKFEFHEYKLHMVIERQIRFIGANQVSGCNSGSKLIRGVIRAIGQTDRVNFVVVMLNANNVPIGAKLVSTGSINRCVAQPREIINAALNMQSTSLILGHNHPSGNPSPSVEDKIVTLMIMAAANVFGINITDHVIVDMDSDQYVSFLENNIIEEMKQKVHGVLDQLSKLK